MGKEATGREKGSRVVTSALGGAKDRIAEALYVKFRVPRQSTLDVLGGLLAGLEHATTAMHAADVTHEAELSDDAPVRTARDLAAKALAGVTVSLRRAVVAAHGEAGDNELGYRGPTQDDPELLLKSASVALERLAKWVPRESLLEGFTFDAPTWRSRLEPAAAALDEALGATAREAAEAKGSLADKSRSLAEYDQVFSAVANLATALLAAAGEQELSRKVRPSTRTPGRTIEQDDEPEGPTDAPAPDAKVA